MSHESANYDTHPLDLRPDGELRGYEDGGVDVVFRQPGTEISVGDIVDHFAMRPSDESLGAAMVQVVGADGRPQAFYLDSEHAVSPAQPWLVADIQKFASTNPAPITVGQPWMSPFGQTGNVHAVVLPYNHGVDHNTLKQAKPGQSSRSVLGRRAIDAVVE